MQLVCTLYFSFRKLFLLFVLQLFRARLSPLGILWVGICYDSAIGRGGDGEIGSVFLLSESVEVSVSPFERTTISCRVAGKFCHCFMSLPPARYLGCFRAHDIAHLWEASKFQHHVEDSTVLQKPEQLKYVYSSAARQVNRLQLTSTFRPKLTLQQLSLP